MMLISDNAHYIVCLRNKRNALKIRALAAQTRPCNPRFIVNSYIDATKPKPTIKGHEAGVNSQFGYGYLIFDFQPLTPEILNFRTNIFPNESKYIAKYVAKDNYL